uniref:E3 ubiquitin-protein ligase listerin n=1 Tax=Macrostomum lignano TaxID=282301 RepID=A0A1I8F501_9PLAT
ISVDAEFLLDTGEALVDCDQIERIADNATVLACLQSAVSRSDLSKSQWDFALCSLTAWLAAAASLSVDQLTRLSARHPAWRLLCRACRLPLWRPTFFAPHLLESQLALFNLTVDLNGFARDSLLARLCLALSSCPPPVLLAHRFPPELRADDATLLASGLTPALQTLLNRPAAPVSAAFAQLIVASLPTVAEGVATAAGAAFSSAGEFGQDSASDAAAASAPVPYCLHERLSQFAVPVPDPLYSRLLSAEPVSGASWLTSPGESRRAASQLLNGLTLLHLVRLARPAELRARLAEWLSSSGYFNQLLLIACPLLPANPAAPAMLQPLGADCGSSIGWRCYYGNDGLDPSSLALDLLVLTLRHVPAMFRDWRTGLTDRRLAGAIDKYVRKWVSPVLCQHELRLVQSAAATAFGSSAANGAAEARELTVKARPAAREIVASYQRSASESASLATIGAVGNCRWPPSCAVRMAPYWTASSCGKRNVDKKFEGVEDCMICYSILHGSNYRLPNLQCRVCRKRFHRACMRQWFETSQNPTCPLCRNTFDFIT